jgi:hypothetical protein
MPALSRRFVALRHPALRSLLHFPLIGFTILFGSPHSPRRAHARVVREILWLRLLSLLDSTAVIQRNNNKKFQTEFKFFEAHQMGVLLLSIARQADC